MLIDSEELRKRLLEKQELNFRTLGNPNKLDDGLMQAVAVLGAMERGETLRKMRASRGRTTKASELIKQLQDAVAKHGDLNVIVRCPADGWDSCDITVWPDPASPAEGYLKYKGTIDINVV